ncbi:pyroglutamyl-peptidase I [Veronia pacifica]|uniref:Pyrrolidone-carboxylate peptidase n=1 Tax=Veronia pacifica TaxID=1080227 RepID=A0A1C3EMM3_9GAMM|nr:pyroglutamyl-peptidase I [Veronia pacifica]ODA34482.1 pyroglutamyl-peptidase I [Veronia pacifica]
MTKILITGFEAFGGETINPTERVIQRLKDSDVNGAQIVTCVAPVVRYESVKKVMSAIEEHKPDAIICLGQAGGRAGVTPERVAINIDDYRIADNAGNQVIDQPVFEDEPAAYFSSLPIKAIVRDLTSAGIQASVSESAGTFVCNHLFYAIQHKLRDTSIRNGFVHIPLLPEQAQNDQPSMSLDIMIKAVKIMINTVLTEEEDAIITGGKIC